MPNDPRAPLTREFFATVQNKLHWAITGQTAAELIYASADATKLFMGLTTWKHAPNGKILKSDVTVAKNYLSEAHVGEVEANRLEQRNTPPCSETEPRQKAIGLRYATHDAPTTRVLSHEHP